MNKQALYKIALKAKKKQNSKEEGNCCLNCFPTEVSRELSEEENTCLHKKRYNGSTCSNVLFYLEDLGIIKILQGVRDRNSGVECGELRVKVLHPEGNKI